jgi:hypothetical protein
MFRAPAISGAQLAPQPDAVGSGAGIRVLSPPMAGTGIALPPQAAQRRTAGAVFTGTVLSGATAEDAGDFVLL